MTFDGSKEGNFLKMDVSWERNASLMLTCMGHCILGSHVLESLNTIEQNYSTKEENFGNTTENDFLLIYDQRKLHSDIFQKIYFRAPGFFPEIGHI